MEEMKKLVSLAAATSVIRGRAYLFALDEDGNLFRLEGTEEKQYWEIVPVSRSYCEPKKE